MSTSANLHNPMAWLHANEAGRGWLRASPISPDSGPLSSSGPEAAECGSPARLGEKPAGSGDGRVGASAEPAPRTVGARSSPRAA